MFDSEPSCLHENGKLWAPMPNLEILKTYSASREMSSMKIFVGIARQ